MEFTFSLEKEIGICSDAASVNIKLWELIKEELGEHYFLSKCISHKFELAVYDAFKDSSLKSNGRTQLRQHLLFLEEVSP